MVAKNTHPMTAIRVHELKNWENSEEYKTLIPKKTRTPFEKKRGLFGLGKK
jgi:hypothetical protein